MISFFRKLFSKSPTPSVIEAEAKPFHSEILAENKEELNRLRAVLKCMTDGVMVLDINGKVLIANKPIASFLGAQTHELLNRHYWELFRDSELNIFLEQALLARKAQKIEHSILLTDTVFEIHVSPVFSEDEYLGVVAVFHDVTDIKKLQNMKNEFVANVSHELKTPLTSIIGYVETLREGAAQDAKLRDQFLDVIDKNAHKLSDLIKQILDLSSLESKQFRLNKEKVSIKSLLRQLIDEYGPFIQKKNIKINDELGEGTAIVWADMAQLRVLFSNLIDNAIKYNLDGGSITFRCDDQGECWVIHVTDTGIGLEENDRQKVFERFYRVDKSRSRETGGSGLGLSIAKQIIDLHAGVIEVHSQTGRGSDFIVSLKKHDESR